MREQKDVGAGQRRNSWSGTVHLQQNRERLLELVGKVERLASANSAVRVGSVRPSSSWLALHPLIGENAKLSRIASTHGHERVVVLNGLS